MSEIKKTSSTDTYIDEIVCIKLVKKNEWLIGFANNGSLTIKCKKIFEY